MGWWMLFSPITFWERKKHDIGMNMWYWNNLGMNIFQWYDLVMNYLNWMRERWRRWEQHRVQVSTQAHDSDTCRGPEIQKYKITAQSKHYKCKNTKIQKSTRKYGSAKVFSKSVSTTRGSLRWQFSWNSSSGWLRVDFLVGTETWMDQLKTP